MGIKESLYDAVYCSGRVIGTAAIFRAVWGVPIFTLDSGKAIVDALMSDKKQEITYDHGSILGTPYPTPYTNWVLPISASVGGLGGLVAGICETRKKNRREGLNKLDN